MREFHKWVKLSISFIPPIPHPNMSNLNDSLMTLLAKTWWKFTFHPSSTAAIPQRAKKGFGVPLCWHSCCSRCVETPCTSFLIGHDGSFPARMEEVCAWGVMSPCTWRMLANVEFYLSFRGICNAWRLPTTLEDGLSCWQACGTEHLVLLHREMWLHNTLNRKGISVDNKYRAPAWSHIVLILTN